MFTSIPALLFLGLLATVLFAVLLIPKRRSRPAATVASPAIAPVGVPLFQSYEPPQPSTPVSIRQQMLDEEAQVLSTAYLDKANEAWRNEVVSKMQGLFAPVATEAEAKKK
jgi:hypothetical protein